MILEACKRGNSSFLQRIIDENKGKVDLNPKDGLGNTPLHYSAQGGHLGNFYRLFSVLLKRFSQTQTDTLELLIKFKANPNIQNQVGDTALHKAVTKNILRAIEVKFHLLFSYEWSTNNILKVLCEGGADANIKNRKGLSPLNMTRGQEVKNCINNISKSECFRANI